VTWCPWFLMSYRFSFLSMSLSLLTIFLFFLLFFFFSSRRRHTRSKRDWSSDVCSSDLKLLELLFEESWFLLHYRIRRRFLVFRWQLGLGLGNSSYAPARKPIAATVALIPGPAKA